MTAWYTAIAIAMASCTPTPSAPSAPRQLSRVPYESLCVTKGSLFPRGDAVVVADPTVRAFVAGTYGDAAEVAFVFRGNARVMRPLGSGEVRRQLGLKLRAANSCNVVYVMWRLDPEPFVEVSVKHNPGARTHEDCGTRGYTKVPPSGAAGVPMLAPGSSHVLRAEIRGDDLFAWIDRDLVWSGALPHAARSLAGPVGFRSDNVELELTSLAAAPGGDATCRRSRGDDF